MKIIEPSAAILAAPNTPDELLKHIERCGRVCYKSEDKITEDSAEKFIGGIIKRGHEAVLEHGDFCFSMSRGLWEWIEYKARVMELHGRKCYLRTTKPGFEDCQLWLVSGNARAWRDFLKFTYTQIGWLPVHFKSFIKQYKVIFPELQSATYLEPGVEWNTKFEQIADYSALTKTERRVHQTVTGLFICDRGVSHEIVRHRPASYCQESTRYCNYSKDGFGSEITVVEPPFFDGANYLAWLDAMVEAEAAYLSLLSGGATPQEARSVLPNSLKTEVVMTANLNEWLHFFKLRTAAAAHPQMRQVAVMLNDEMSDIIADLLEDCDDGKE